MTSEKSFHAREKGQAGVPQVFFLNALFSEIICDIKLLDLQTTMSQEKGDFAHFFE